MRASYIFKILLCVIIGCLLIGVNSFAQDDPLPEWIKRQNIEQRLTPLGNDLMGDRIDPATGSLVFTHIDVDIPGNFALPVRIERKRTMGPRYVEGIDVEFADWELVVPKISAATVNEGDWYSNVNRCTGNPYDLFPTVQTGSGAYMTAQSYTNGIHMSAPGAGGRELLYVSSKAPLNPTADSPEFPTNAEFVTTDNWYFTCINAVGGGQGLLGHAPNGDKYHFNRSIKRETDNGRYSHVHYTPSHERYSVMLMATKVEDVHGNYVDYTYDTSTDRLTQIEASDGRKITLAYSGDLISSITSNPGALSSSGTPEQRIWTYDYRDTTIKWPYWTTRALNPLRDNMVLEKVTQPDGLFWDFDLDNMSTPSRPSEPCRNSGVTMNLTHPYGASGTFRVEPRDFRIGKTDLIRFHHDICDPNGEIIPGLKTQYIKKSAIYSYAVKFKTIVNAGVSNTWTYAYEEDRDNFLNITTMTDPEGSKTRFEHYFNWFGGTSPNLERGGRLKRKQYLDDSDNVLRTEEVDWTTDGEIGWFISSSNTAPKSMRGLQDEVIITQDGDTYTTEKDYNTDKTLANYSYGLPVETRTSSNFNTTPRVRTTNYIHETTSPWIIGLPDVIEEGIASDMRELVDYDYDTLGRKTSQKLYGAPQATFGYSNVVGAKGALISIEDALPTPRKVSAANWHRGKPQSVTRAADTTESVTIGRTLNADGRIMDQTDGRGYKTSYARDNMGRLKNIYPYQDLSAVPAVLLSQTNINYYFGNAEIRQLIDKGYERQFIYYDRLFRPILEHRIGRVPAGSSAVAPPDKFITTKYDGLGRVIFKSLPYGSATFDHGTTYTYDALGRVLTETSEFDENVKTTYEYLANNCTRVKDAYDNATTTCKDGYGGPGGGDVVKITQPESVITEMFYTNYGELEEVTQTGSVNPKKYFYDSQSRVCRYRTPEAGDTLYKYDSAGQMTSYAKGIDDDSDDCVDPTGDTVVSLTYDKLGRLKTTLFNDTDTPDIWRDYDENGNLLKVYRGQTSDGPCLTDTLNANCWFYDFDAYNRLVAEELQIDDRSFEMTYKYNGYGFMMLKTLPTGEFIPIINDVLGRTLSIGFTSGAHANTFSYHVNDQVKRFRYGNKQDYQTDQNMLQQTTDIHIQKPANSTEGTPQIWAVDMNYTHDLNGRLKTQLDALEPDNDRTYNYDTLGRLESAFSPHWGTADYTYDAMGNLLTKTFDDWNGTNLTRTVTNSYDTVNDTNRVTSTTDSHNIAYGFVYDLRGNVIQTGGLKFTYDKADQPIAMFPLDGTGAAPNTGVVVNGSYEYDGNLKRVKSIVNGITRYNVYDHQGRQTHVEEDDGNYVSETNYLHGAGMTLARIKDGVFTYMHPDHLGSPQTGTDATGAVEWNEYYTPFGEALVEHAANDNQSGFTGHIKDADTGLNYMQARYYDPNIGRFLSIDPVTFADTGNPGMFNRYAYTWNDPVNLIDPYGTHPTVFPENPAHSPPPPKPLGESIPGPSSIITDLFIAITGAVMNDGDDGEIKEGDEVGGITATGDDEANETFDPEALPHEQPANEEEADLIRDVTSNDWGGEEPEIREEDLGNPRRKGQEKMRYEHPNGTDVHYYREVGGRVGFHGKIKSRPLKVK